MVFMNIQNKLFLFCFSLISAFSCLEGYQDAPLPPQTECEQLAVIFAKYANNPEGISALHYAVLQDDAFAIDLLLKYGASPFTKSFDRTSFYYAIVAGNLELVDKFLKLQLDPNLGCNSNEEPLKVAIREHQNKIAKYIINSGVDLYKFTSPGNDYLFECCCSGNSEVFVYLMEQGVKSPNNDYSEYFLRLTANYEGKAQEKCLVEGKIEILKYLDSRNIIKTDFTNSIPFGYLYPETLQYLLDYRFIQPNMKRNNRPILFDVVWGDILNLELTKILLDYGADVNAKDSSGRNILFDLTSQALVNKGLREMISLMVAHGANLNAKDKQGKTLLNFVTDNDMREFLISLGAKE
jgi:ankyrin repeat protein